MQVSNIFVLIYCVSWVSTENTFGRLFRIKLHPSWTKHINKEWKFLAPDYSPLRAVSPTCQNNMSMPSSVIGYNHRICSDSPQRKCSAKRKSACTVQCASRGEKCSPSTRCCPLASVRPEHEGLLVNYCRNYVQSQICRVCASHGGRCGPKGFPCCEGFACRGDNICVHRRTCNLQTSRNKLHINGEVYISRNCTHPELGSPQDGFIFECRAMKANSCAKCALPETKCRKSNDCCQKTRPIGIFNRDAQPVCVGGTCGFCGGNFEPCDAIAPATEETTGSLE